MTQSFATTRAFVASAWAAAGLLRQRRLRLPSRYVGRQLRFADGTTSRIYRETVLEGVQEHKPALLVVCFQLRLVRRSRLLHGLFRLESIVNTPLFAGFPGFRSKLWATDTRTGVYRGVYEWDGADRAEAYVTTLARLLRPVCLLASVRYHIEPGIRRDDFLRDPTIVDPSPTIETVAVQDGWWRLSAPVTP